LNVILKEYKAITCLISFSLVAGCSAQNTPAMFRQAKGSPLKVGQHPADLALVDVNRDGKLDILTANLNSKDISVLLGDGTGSFVPALGSPFKVKYPPHHVSAGDLNKDGKIDLALTCHDSYEVVILWGDGKGGFTESESPVKVLDKEDPHNHGLALADFNGDGNLDITTSNNGDNSVSVLLGDGQGGFTSAKGSPYSAGRETYPLAASDLNQDQNLDILIPNVGSSSISVLFGDG